jgi:hypothetical protein
MIRVRFTEILKEKLLDLGEVNLSEAFLPIIGDSIRLPLKSYRQFRVVDRHFWVEGDAENITIFLEETKVKT